MKKRGNYSVEKVKFPSNGETCVGDLYMPSGTGPHPFVVCLGPYSFQKEQAPTQYATRLADLGYAALAFDPRTVGESSGTPRRMEVAQMKNADTVAAFDYLYGRPDMDKNRGYLLGICQGASQVLDIASKDSRVKGVASVVAYWRDKQNDMITFSYGVDGAFDPNRPLADGQMEHLFQMRMERARMAKELFDTTGEVIYRPLVSPETGDRVSGPIGGLTGPGLFAWYSRWANTVPFENRYAIMSDVENFTYTTAEGIAKLDKPTIIVHSALPGYGGSAPKYFESIPTKDKKLVMSDQYMHFDFYDKPITVDFAVGEVVDWFDTHQ